MPKSFMSYIKKTSSLVGVTDGRLRVFTIGPGNTFLNLPNALPGVAVMQASGNTLVNAVKNGNFASGTTGWAPTGGTISSSNNELILTEDTASSEHYAQYALSSTLKPYVGMKLFVRAAAATKGYLVAYNRKSDGTYEQLGSNAVTVGGVCYLVFTVTSVYATPSLFIRLYGVGGVYTGASVVYKFSNVIAIDLTAAGLESKTVAELNDLTLNYFEGVGSTCKATSQNITNLVTNGNFANGVTGWVNAFSTLTTNSNTLVVTGNGTGNVARAYRPTSVPSVTGKKLYLSAKAKVTNSLCTEISLQARSQDNSILAIAKAVTFPGQDQYYTLTGVVTVAANWVGNINAYITHAYTDAATASGKVMEVQNVICMDLTALGLESKTVAELDAMTQQYFEGTTPVYSDTVVSSRGVNMLDFSTNSLELGFITSADGTLSTSASTVRTKNFIPIKPSTAYRLAFTPSAKAGGADLVVFLYDSNKNFIRVIPSTPSTSIASDATAGYMKIRTHGSYVYTIEEAIALKPMLNEGATALPYSPYKFAQVKLNDCVPWQYLPLEGFNGVKDEVTCRGTVIKRSGKTVLNGSETWGTWNTSLTNVISFSISLPNAKISAKGLSNLFKFVADFSLDEEHFYISSSNALVIYISKTKATDVATFKAWLAANPVTVVYELNTPVEVPLAKPFSVATFPGGSVSVETNSLLPVVEGKYRASK